MNFLEIPSPRVRLSSLYKFCLRKIAIYLRDGMYKSCPENIFSTMPYKFVSDLLSAALDLQRGFMLRLDGLELLLTSGKIREFKIHGMEVRQHIVQVIKAFSAYCQELEVLHLTLLEYRSDEPDLSEAINNLLRNAPNMQDLHCCLRFDLRALRNCKKLRSVTLDFLPRQPLYDFLAKENGLFQTHRHLEFYSVCRYLSSRTIPNSDVVVLLLYCPELTNLGYIDSSGALLQLLRMGMLLSELKLRHFYWKESRIQNPPAAIVRRYAEDENRVSDALLHYPFIEEMYIITSSVEIISSFRSFKNLVLLNITLNGWKIESKDFSYVLRDIGPQLKHLSLETQRPMDISLFLQDCPNLESLRVCATQFRCLSANFSQPAVSLPNLQRLTLNSYFPCKQFFSLLSDCNQLTELFLVNATPSFDDETLHLFLNKNSLQNLKITYMTDCDLTEQGFREFILNAPKLEIAEIDSWGLHNTNNSEMVGDENDFEMEGVEIDDNYADYESIIRETNHKAIFNKRLLSDSDEFFVKRRF